MTTKTTHFIGGKWISGTGPLFQSINPATEEVVWEGNEADELEVDEAVKAARRAFTDWSQQEVESRIHHLKTFRDILTKEKATLADTISKENGKTLWESVIEVTSMIGKVDISIDAYHIRCPDVHKAQPSGMLTTKHRPHGVISVLSPFNFPGHMPNSHIIPALLAGNTIVLKPSEVTPLTAELTVKYWEESGLPQGVINLVQGGRATGVALSQHPDIDGLLFTGSWATGSQLAELMGKTPNKILALEMGGNNALVIGRISDLKTAAYLTIQSAFLSAGQRCTCARRLIVPEGPQGDRFLQTLVAMTKTLKIGPYTDKPEPFMGPVINKQTASRLLAAQKELISLGGIPILPLFQLDQGPAFLSPGIIDMTQVSGRPDEELFGPFLQLIRVKDFKEAIEEANRTRYGLTAGLLSDSKEEFDEFYKASTTGLFTWNTQMTGGSSAAPFGGIGRSGNNRPSGYYAADYCAYPFVSLESPKMLMPTTPVPGVTNG
ncbi:MAG: succinylglutamate-semialdehyde dehydrogenase [Parachlamydiaceae bacterium]